MKDLQLLTRDAPDIRPAGYPAIFQIRYPAGYPAIFQIRYPAGYPVRHTGYPAGFSQNKMKF